MNQAHGKGRKRPHGARQGARGPAGDAAQAAQGGPVAPEPVTPEPVVERAPLPLLVADPNEEFSGREIRRLTARVTASRADAGPGQLFGDVAYVVVSVAISVLFVIGAANVLRETIFVEPVDGRAPVLTPATIQALASVALLALLTGMAVRLGPLGTGSAGVRWWVPMPVDRRGLLTPSYWRGVAVAVVVGAGGLAAIALASGADPGVAGRSAALGAAAGLLLVGLAGLIQPRTRVAATVARVSDVLIAAVPVAGVVLVVAGWSDLRELSVPPWAIVVVGAGALALAVVWWRRLEALGAQVLRTQSAVADQAGGAILSLDTRELGRALSRAGSTRGGRARRPSRFSVVRGPVSALVAADLTLLRRSPSALAQLVGLTALVIVAQQVPAFEGGFGLFVLLVVAGFRGAQLGAEGARTAEMVPSLDAMMPLSARDARLARTVVPALTALLALVVGVVPLVLGTGEWLWFALVVVVAVGMGAAAIRGAYRKPPNWSGPLVATPAGALPTGATSMIAQGPDVAVLSAIPLGICLLVGAPTLTLVVFQGIAVWIALAVASHVRATGAKPLLG
ncbi:DUF6297 family protein [Oerskovia paurometabola]|uniref:DUF6297 family protein n=1 Tax=Oerskovia paurometabola TaxID=162170 RepID=A0ABW1XD21_9CELL|nr:DUF6297 family protein [Oerskovia paurometabola]MBM7496982.1 hypothetical protein [Oerskovia paurometabola]